MDNANQGFLYFDAGLASWTRESARCWLLRVDLVCHQPLVMRVASAAQALAMAEKMADQYESAMRDELTAVGFTNNGRTLYGKLPEEPASAAADGGSEKVLPLA
jgi:hypothetical protein